MSKNFTDLKSSFCKRKKIMAIENRQAKTSQELLWTKALYFKYLENVAIQWDMVGTCPSVK